MHISLLVCGLFFLVVTAASADLYQWTDESGVIHVVDESSQIPESYRKKVKVFESQKSRTPPSALPLSPSRMYPEYSEGRFAQKLALDLGLIKSPLEDAIGPLTNVGIRPASSWQVNDPLAPERWTRSSTPRGVQRMRGDLHFRLTGSKQSSNKQPPLFCRLQRQYRSRLAKNHHLNRSLFMKLPLRLLK